MKTKTLPPRWLLLFAGLVINVVWASSYPISKQLMLGVSPLMLTTLRITLTSLFLLPTMPLRPLRKMSWKDAGLFGVMGIVGTVLATLLQYAGTQRTSASNASVLVALEPVLIVIFSARLLGEKISRITWISLVLALIGVMLITLDPRAMHLLDNQYFHGNLLVLLSVASYSLYSIAGKSLISHWSNSIVTTFPFVLSAVFLLPITWALDPNAVEGLYSYTAAQWAVILYLSLVATALSYLCWNWLLKHLSASFVSYSLYIQPIAGAIFSSMILGESFSHSFLLGASLIFAALLLEQKAMRVV